MCELVTTESSFVTCLQRVRKGVLSSASTRSDQVSRVQASYKVSIYGYIIFWTKKNFFFWFPAQIISNQSNHGCMYVFKCVISPSVPVKAMPLTQNNGKIFFWCKTIGAGSDNQTRSPLSVRGNNRPNVPNWQERNKGLGFLHTLPTHTL